MYPTCACESYDRAACWSLCDLTPTPPTAKVMLHRSLNLPQGENARFARSAHRLQCFKLDVRPICLIDLINHLLIFFLNDRSLELFGGCELALLLREVRWQDCELLNLEGIVRDKFAVLVSLSDRLNDNVSHRRVPHRLADRFDSREVCQRWCVQIVCSW